MLIITILIIPRRPIMFSHKLTRKFMISEICGNIQCHLELCNTNNQMALSKLDYKIPVQTKQINANSFDYISISCLAKSAPLNQ